MALFVFGRGRLARVARRTIVDQCRFLRMRRFTRDRRHVLAQDRFGGERIGG